MKAFKYYVIRISLALFLVLAFGLGPELAVRLIYRARHGAWPLSLASATRRAQAESASLFVEHSILPFTLRPGARLRFADTDVEVNSSGFRGPELRSETPLRILVVGGSTTFDTGVTDEVSTWCRQLETRLQDAYPGVEVINGGVPVYATWTNCFKYMLYDHRVRPDVVLIYQGLNDTLRWWPAIFGDLPFTDYWQYRGCHARAYSGMQGAQNVAQAPVIPNLLAHSILLRGAFNERGRNEHLFDNMSQARTAAASVPGMVLAENNEMLSRFVEAIRGSGAIPVIVPQGIGSRNRRQVGNAQFAIWVDGLRLQGEAYLRQAKELGAKTIDVLDTTFAWGDEYFMDSMHFNDAGARALAELLAPILARDEDLKRIHRSQNATVRSMPARILDRVVVPDASAPSGNPPAKP